MLRTAVFCMSMVRVRVLHAHRSTTMALIAVHAGFRELKYVTLSVSQEQLSLFPAPQAKIYIHNT